MADRQPPRAAVRAAVRAALADLEPGDRVLVALSGGADSLALLAATVLVCQERGLVCGAVVVDHQLQTGSAAIAARAAEQARILGCSDVRVVAVEVEAGQGSGGPEAVARAARYAALDRAAGAHDPATHDPASREPASHYGATHDIATHDPATREPASHDGATHAPAANQAPAYREPPAAAVLLGHTRDDQAETVLLGLARGSGTRSLAGMAPRAGRYRRPLLDLPRELVARAAAEAAAEDPRLRPWADPHNDDPAFARVRVRAEVLPVLESALGPGTSRALARTAALAREDADALDAWAERVLADLCPEDLHPPNIHPPNLHPPNLHPPDPRPPGLHPPNLHPPDLHPPSAPATEPAPATLPIARLRRTATDPLPPAIVTRVVRRFLVSAGCPVGSLTALHVHAVAALIDSTNPRAEVALPGGLRARREQDDLRVRA